MQPELSSRLIALSEELSKYEQPEKVEEEEEEEEEEESLPKSFLLEAGDPSASIALYVYARNAQRLGMSTEEVKKLLAMVDYWEEQQTN